MNTPLEESPLGTGGAIREAGDLLANSFLVIYGDSYLPIDYAAVLNALNESDAAGIVTVYDNTAEDTGVTNNIAINQDGYITKYIKDCPDDPDLRFVEAGVLGLTKSVAQKIPNGKVSLEEEMFPKLIKGGQMLGFVTRQRFYDIGTPERLQRIAHLFES